MRSAPDVFLSYSHLDREAASRLAHSLQTGGLKVFWDEPIIAPDEHRVRTAEAIRGAKAAIVLWTPHSLDNRVVQEEAAEAARLGKLVALADGGVDVAPPDHLTGQSLIAASDGAALTAALASRGITVPVGGLTTATISTSLEPRRQAPTIDLLIARTSKSEPEARRSEPSPVAVLVEPAISPKPAYPAPIAIAPLPPPLLAEHTQVSPRPVLRLRCKQQNATGTARASLTVAIAGLAMILAVFVLTSGLLHAFGLGK